MSRPVGARDDGNATLDAADDDWEWRRRIRSNPASHRVYRIVVGLVGLLIVVGGLALVPLPGPGWVIVFVGLAVWASEFEWAHRLLQFARHRLHVWSEWLKPRAVVGQGPGRAGHGRPGGGVLLPAVPGERGPRVLPGPGRGLAGHGARSGRLDRPGPH